MTFPIKLPVKKQGNLRGTFISKDGQDDIVQIAICNLKRKDLDKESNFL